MWPLHDLAWKIWRQTGLKLLLWPKFGKYFMDTIWNQVSPLFIFNATFEASEECEAGTPNYKRYKNFCSSAVNSVHNITPGKQSETNYIRYDKRKIQRNWNGDDRWRWRHNSKLNWLDWSCLPRSPIFIKYIFSSFFLTLTHISEIWMISTLVCCSGTKALRIEVWPLSRQVLTRSERKREKGWSMTSAGQPTFNHSNNSLNLDCMQVHEETREDSVCWTAQQEIPQRAWGIKYWNLTF